MKYIAIFLLVACYYSIPLSNYKQQFEIEINKFKPVFEDKDLGKLVAKLAKEYEAEYSFTNKVVDLNNVFKTCHLDFEINLVNSKELPASNHLINHIIVGGLIIPGQKYKRRKNDLWACNVGVVLRKDDNTVYSLLYDMRVHYDRNTFMKKAPAEVKNVDDTQIVNQIFYNKCYEILQFDMSLKTKDDEIIKEKY